MRGFLIAIPIVLIVMSMPACQGSSGPAGEQGPPGPVGPAGPTGEAATLDKDELQLVLQQLESAEARITADGPASGQQLMQGQTEASVPPKWMPEAYTNYFVREAIRRYESDGLDSTVAYYNTKESVDGQWYVFMIDEDRTVIAHANPALVRQLASDITGPNNYPTGAAVAASADENGAWFDYTFTNPATDSVETKHSWMVIHDGITFGSGWYEEGPRKTDGPAYTQAVVQQAINLYEALGLDSTVAYYDTEESVDGRDEDGTVICQSSFGGTASLGRPGPQQLPHRRRRRCLVRLHFHQPCHGLGGDQTFLDGNSRRDLRVRLVRGRATEDRRPSLHPSSSPAGYQSLRSAGLGFHCRLLRHRGERGRPVDMIDEDGTVIAHANPALVGQLASDVLGPNNYPTGGAVAASADENGAWFDYTFTNPATDSVETKHSWMVIHDGVTFGSGWYEEGPRKTDAPAYTEAVVQQAINLYEAVGLEDTVAYYNTTESVDGQWYAFIVNGESGFTIAHHNPVLRGRGPSLRVDPTGYFYGDDLLGATEAGRWMEYVIVNPETGENQRKHTFAVLHDGYIFASGWYGQ